MFSYRHGFHAGMHADVLKHVVLLQLLRYLTQKEKPLWYIDTHAGAGMYALDAGYAAKTQEYESGVARLWERDDLPHGVADYVAAVRSLNPDGRLQRYPGSPQLALQVLREHDRLRLFEWHSNESKLLLRHFRDAGPRALAYADDGFAGLQALLPTPSRRALVLIDPSYEDKKDYRHVLAALRDAQKRMRTGVYAVWYPLVQRRESRQFSQQLRQLQDKDWLDVDLIVKKPAADGLGLHGSGMFILNPPWSLRRVLEGVMPFLVQVLGQDGGAGYTLESELA